MTDHVNIELPGDRDLRGVTAGGLPYPESSGPLNQGANDIKALALALEARGLGLRHEARTLTLQNFSGGLLAVNFVTPFAAAPAVIWTPGYPFTVNNTAFTTGIASVSASQVTLACYVISPTPGWYSGGLTFSYLAIGS